MQVIIKIIKHTNINSQIRSKLHGIFNFWSIFSQLAGPNNSYIIPLAPNNKTKTKEIIFIINKKIFKNFLILMCTPFVSPKESFYRGKYSAKNKRRHSIEPRLFADLSPFHLDCITNRFKNQYPGKYKSHRNKSPGRQIAQYYVPPKPAYDLNAYYKVQSFSI